MSFFDELASDLSTALHGMARASVPAEFRAFCTELGLQESGPRSYMGVRDGLNLRCEWYFGGENSDPGIRTTVKLPMALPTGTTIRTRSIGRSLFNMFSGLNHLPLGHPIDAKVQATARAGEANAIRHLLTQPPVLAPLDGLLSARTLLDIADDSLKIRMDRGAHTWQPALEQAIELAHAITGLQYEPWGLLDGFLLCDDRQQGWGTVDGVHLRLSTRQHRHRIAATLPRPFAPGTRIDAGTDGPSLHDPILDGRVRVVADDLTAVRQRLCTDDVRGALLDVLYSPATQARIDATTLHVELPGHPSLATPSWLHRVAELARLL